MLEYIPIINEKNIVSKIVDNDKMYLQSKFLTNKFILNKTGETIINLIDGRSTVTDIVNIIGEKYNVSKDVLERDVEELISDLFSKGFISWKNGMSPYEVENTYKLDDRYKIVTVTFNDIDLLKSFKKSEVNYIYPYYNKFNLLNLVSSNLVLSIKNSYVLYKDDEPLIFLALDFNHENFMMNVRYIWENEKITKKEIDIFLQNIVTIYKQNNYIPKGHEISYLIMIDEKSIYNEKILNNYNFNSIGKLERELEGDIGVLVYKK